MDIKGKVHCFFEQSGTFKNEFKKLGIPAEDYDIQDNFGETDHVSDLFLEIENAYDDKTSIFDRMSQDDLIIAFFPCIYFCGSSQMMFYWTAKNNQGLEGKVRMDSIIERNHNRALFFDRLMKLAGICIFRNIRLIVENPFTGQTHLKAAFLKSPDIIDTDRTQRGDFFSKPTAYWFFNCEPEHGLTYQKDKVKKTIEKCKHGKEAGLCSEERSMISPDYARNLYVTLSWGRNRNLKINNYQFFENDGFYFSQGH